MSGLNNLNFTSPVIEKGITGSFIKDTNNDAKKIINSFKTPGQIIITAHLSENPYGGNITDKKTQPQLVLDTMYLNPGNTITLDDQNKGFEITSGGLIESNRDNNIKSNVLVPLKSLLSVTEVKQGSQGVQPAGGVPGASPPLLPSTADTGEKIVEQATQIKNHMNGERDPAKLNEFKAKLEILKTNINKLSIDDTSSSDAENAVQDALIDVRAALTPQSDTQPVSAYSLVGGSTRRRKYKKRTTRRNKRRTYRYKK